MASNIAAVSSLGAVSDLAARAYPDAGKGYLWTDDPHIELPVRVSRLSGSLAALPPQSLPQAFKKTVQNYASFPAFRVKRGGDWQETTFTQYYEQARRFGKACLSPAVALQRFQGVGILAFNGPEWAISAYGSIFAGGLQAGIYLSNTPESVAYVLEHCEAAVAVVDDEEQLAKVLSVRHSLPYLKAIVLTVGNLPKTLTSQHGIYTWEAFLALGDAVGEDVLEARMDAQAPGECCSLIYTSGTTGNPKAVMLSHDNIVFTAHTANVHIKARQGDVIVSYLPLSHIAAQLADLHGPMVLGITVAFAQPDALKGSLVLTLQEVRPDYFLGVPRVYEKIEEKLRAIGAQNAATSPLKKAIGDWAKSVGAEASAKKLRGDVLPLSWTIAEALVFRNIRAALGLDRCRMLGTGAAPIAVSTLEYFASLGMIIREIYGMSETCGPHTTNVPTAGGTKFGTVGRPVTGVEVKLANPDPVTGEGEVCMRGRNVFMGYLKNPAATREAIDHEGWLHSGDLGVYDPDGFLRITGRIKELIITAGGENVAPILMENKIKDLCSGISNVVLIGDKQKFIAALITLKTDPKDDGSPSKQLSESALLWTCSIGSSVRTTDEALHCPKIRTAIQDAITRANSTAISNAARVQRWEMVPTDFSVLGGELTPTLKLKRRVVSAKYASLIDALYSEHYDPHKTIHLSAKL